MDTRQFDQLVAKLGSGRNRRQALGAVLGALLVGHTLTDADEAATKSRGQCNPACSECATCQKGKCHRSRSGRRRCRPGTCLPITDGTVCSGGRACQNGICSCADPARGCGQTCCRPDQVCYDGRCRCAAGHDECQGRCQPWCPNAASYVRNPHTCECCQRSGATFPGTCPDLVKTACCSGTCSPVPAMEPPEYTCMGQDPSAL